MLRLICPGCGGQVPRIAARHRATVGPRLDEVAPLGPSTVGPVALRWRAMVLRILEHLYWSVTAARLARCLLALGGFVPGPAAAGCCNEIDGWGDVVRPLGGVWFRVETRDPDSDLGPVLARVDAPLLFASIDTVARRLGVKPPGQVRLTYLPCCGVVAWGRSQALLIGLPLLRVLTQGELRAVLAHELAHLARGDATGAARSARFVEGLELAVEQAGTAARGPLGAWARFCLREASWLIEPVARSQEARADRHGGDHRRRRRGGLGPGQGRRGSARSSARCSQHYDPNHPEYPNLYAFFRTFWYRLPAESLSAMRLRVLTAQHSTHDPAHPPLPDRLAHAPVATPTGSAPTATPSGHHVPGRPRDLRADAPQPALQPARRRAHRLPPRGLVSRWPAEPSLTSPGWSSGSCRRT